MNNIIKSTLAVLVLGTVGANASFQTDDPNLQALYDSLTPAQRANLSAYEASLPDNSAEIEAAEREMEESRKQFDAQWEESHKRFERDSAAMQESHRKFATEVKRSQRESDQRMQSMMQDFNAMATSFSMNGFGQTDEQRPALGSPEWHAKRDADKKKFDDNFNKAWNRFGW